MKYLDLSFPTPPENLALDEALLDLSEDGHSGEILRFWEPGQYFVVAGYSNKIHLEVNLNSCREEGVPIFRRISGGGTVLQGPGCLNYALILSTERPGMKDIVSSTSSIMNAHAKAIEKLINSSEIASVLPSAVPRNDGATESAVIARSPQDDEAILSLSHHRVEVKGYSDLTIRGLKFSGNSQRRRKNYFLFHGSFLTGMNLGDMARLLALPSKEPSYRGKRSHRDFLTNISISSDRIKLALRQAWQAGEPLKDLPSSQIDSLVQQKYSLDSWNFKF